MTTTAAKELPIIMSGMMVEALLRGSEPKTLTRRIIAMPDVDMFEPLGRDTGFSHHAKCPSFCDFACGGCEIKPRYAVGSRLWVKETFRVHGDFGNDKASTSCCTGPKDCEFAADFSGEQRHIREWRPSIFMPRWASRITLEVIDVWVSRVQDITEADAIACGLRRFTKDERLWKWWPCDPCDGPMKCAWADLPRDPREALRALWDHLHGEGAWARNDWVWNYRFKMVSAPAGLPPAAQAIAEQTSGPRMNADGRGSERAPGKGKRRNAKRKYVRQRSGYRH